MIAAADGDDAASALLGPQAQGFVEGPAHLEGAGLLKHLQLDVDVGLQALASVALGVSGVRRMQGAIRWRAAWICDRERTSDMNYLV